MVKRKARGRHTRLNPDTEAVIVGAVKDGFALTAAARLADVAERSVYNWLSASPRFKRAVLAAQKAAAEIKIASNPRPLARARYEREESPEQLTNLFYKEIVRCRQEGRVPYDVALAALRLAVDELEDKMADESISWADEPAKAPAHGGHRGRST